MQTTKNGPIQVLIKIRLIIYILNANSSREENFLSFASLVKLIKAIQSKLKEDLS